MIRLAHLLVATAMLTSAALASRQVPAPAQDHPIVIRGATIHPVSGPEIPNGTLIFDNGKITAVGADAQPSANAEVIDATGKHVYPGLISANSAVGLTEISAVRSTVDLAEPGSINPNARAVTSINPDSELIPVARANGILTMHTIPEGGSLCGQSAVLRLDGWTPEEMTVRSPAAMHVRWPNMKIDRSPRATKSA